MNLVWNHTRDLNSDECTARVPFEITSMMSDQNCTACSSIITLINTAILKFQNSVSAEYLIDPVGG